MNLIETSRIRIGQFYIIARVEHGDLTLNVYPLDTHGIPWDSPIDIFEVSAADCKITD